MKRLFDEDQAARQSPPKLKDEGGKIFKDDAVRRLAAKALISGGALHTADDFFRASTILQHGDSADDYLLAHTLACIAVSKGNQDALWMVTATLDRYLSKMGQPQIYGTQFHRTPTTPWTMEPYNRDLISDGLRKELGVPSEAKQEKQLEKMNAPSK